MSGGEFVHSVNIMVILLLLTVCYFIYYIFTLDNDKAHSEE